MLRSRSVCSNEWQVDISALSRGECNLGLLTFFFQTLKRHLVGAEVDAVALFKLSDQVIDQSAVPVITTEVRVTVRRFNFKNAVADFENRDVKGATTQVVNGDHFVLSLIQAIGECCGRRLVNNTLHFKTGNLTGILSRLALRIVKVSRHCDDRFGHSFTEISFSIGLQLSKNHGGDLFGSKLLLLTTHLALDVSIAVFTRDYIVWKRRGLLLNFVELASDKALRRENRIARIRDCLALRRLADESLAALGKCHNRRSGACTLRIWYHNRFPTFHHGHAGVRCA